MDNYSTHLPFLEFIVDTFKPRNVIEFGMGNYSTPLLAEHCDNLTSIETDETWFNEVITDNIYHKQILWSADNVQDYLLANNNVYDLAFVDGPVRSRIHCIHNLFGRADLIVFHDSIICCYRWDLLSVPENYKRFDYLDLSPTTSVFSSNPDHWKAFQEREQSSVNYT